MSSTEHVSVAKYAVEICDDYDLKREILCACGSDYDLSAEGSSYYDRKEKWNEIVQKKAALILENSGFPEIVIKQIEEVVIPIGMRMLTWAVYHESAIGFSREYSIDSFKSSFFTEEGTVDNKKAAEELMKDESLNVKQKYKLACLYCFEAYIYDLYEQMTKEEKENLQFSHSGLIKFWSSNLMGEMDLRGEKTFDEIRLEMAIQNGSKAAVEYCINKSPLKNDDIINSAVAVMRNIIWNERYNWIVFHGQRLSNDSWVPSADYVDILRYLLSQMTEAQRIEFLEKDIKTGFKECYWMCSEHSRVLDCFLKWPHQSQFVKTAKLMWGFLPDYNYAILLLKISDKIAPINTINIEYGEEKCFDYRGLLQEFWCASPDRYKRYVFSNERVTYMAATIITVKAATRLLINLLSSECFDPQDGQAIRLIFGEATDMEKAIIISDVVKSSTCSNLVKNEKWGLLDAFVENCFPSKEKADEFKNDPIFGRIARDLVVEFLGANKWDAVESFTRWCSLSGEKLNEFKRRIADSEDIPGKFWNLILNEKNVKLADDILKWCLSSEEDIENLKEGMIFSEFVLRKSAELLSKDKTDDIEEFISWCRPSQHEIGAFKKSLSEKMGCYVSNILESKYFVKNAEFEEKKWKRVESWLSWCCLSEEEITAFKKKILIKSGVEIHFKMINSNRYEEAETLFDWLGLSAGEITELKKNTLYCYVKHEVIKASAKITEKLDYRIIMWCLTDKGTTRKLLNTFRERFERPYQDKEEKEVIERFYLTLEEHCRILNEDKQREL